MYTVIGQLTRLATKGIVYVADDEQSCSFCSMKWQDVLPKALSAATGLRLHVIQFECACTAAFSISAVLCTTCKLHSSTIRTSYVPCVLWFWCILHDFVCICTYILPKVLLKIFICMLPPGWPCHWHVCMIPLCSNKKKSLQCVLYVFKFLCMFLTRVITHDFGHDCSYKVLSTVLYTRLILYSRYEYNVCHIDLSG